MSQIGNLPQIGVRFPKYLKPRPIETYTNGSKFCVDLCPAFTHVMIRFLVGVFIGMSCKFPIGALDIFLAVNQGT